MVQILFAKLNDSKVGGITEIFTISELIEKGVVDKGFTQYAKAFKLSGTGGNRTDIFSFSAWFVK